ncbi:hypothetical protein H0H81_000612 [Sphagnurus paluster]|uniref:SnoaL-like domain-containing protein n=1 Tax=Sphagnurus paluster TaxID=117069 RepID=A0A9P7FPX4_9AGAR|nr:hypothetical protein H0H81_000612 [Sphagnurus paluster]
MSNTNQSTYTPSTSPSPNIRATLAWVDAYNELDVNKLSALVDESLQFEVLPKSLGRPISNKEEYLTNFEKHIIPLFKRFHASSEGESVLGSVYKNEYVIFLHFVPPKEGGDGLPKISVVKEFTDSHTTLEFIKEEQARAAANAKKTVSD